MSDRPLSELRAFIELQRVASFFGAAACFVAALAIDAPEFPWFRAWVNMEDPGGMAWMLRALALGAAIGGVHLFRTAWKNLDPDTHPLVELLLRRPESVVWVAATGGVEQQVNGVAVARSKMLIAYTDAGTTEHLEINERRLDAILDELEAHLPHATFGFTHTRLARWREDPASLRLAPAGAAPYRAPAGEQDRERIRPKVGPAPLGALIVAVLLGLRLLLAADCNGASEKPTPAWEGP